MSTFSTKPQGSQPEPKRRAATPPAPRGAGEQAWLDTDAPELLEGPSREDLIRRRAYDLYERNGCVDGHALDDWLAAEVEVDRIALEGASAFPEPTAQD